MKLELSKHRTLTHISSKGITLAYPNILTITDEVIEEFELHGEKLITDERPLKTLNLEQIGVLTDLWYSPLWQKELDRDGITYSCPDSLALLLGRVQSEEGNHKLPLVHKFLAQDRQCEELQITLRNRLKETRNDQTTRLENSDWYKHVWRQDNSNHLL